MHTTVRHDRGQNSTNIFPSTFTKLGNIDNNGRNLYIDSYSDATASRPSSKVPLYWSNTLGRNGVYSTSSLDGRISDAELSVDHQEELDKIERKNLKMEGQLLNAFKTSHKNLSSSGEFTEAKPPLYNNIEQSSLLKRRLSRMNPSSPSGWPNNSKSYHDSASEIIETNSVRLVPIGIQSLEPSVQTLLFRDVDTAPRASRSRSMARGQKEASAFSRSASQQRKETKNSRQSNLFHAMTWQHLPDSNSNNNSNNTYSNNNYKTNSNITGKVNTTSVSGDLWYKPNLSREWAVRHLMDKPRGSFVVRKSSTHPGCYSLVLKSFDNTGDRMSQGETPTSIRHFLIDTTEGGLQLRGYKNEPEFATLKAMVEYYKKNLSALPCRLSSKEEKILVQYIKTISSERDISLDVMKRAFDVCLINAENIQVIPLHVQLDWNGVSLISKEKISHLKSFYSYGEITLCCIDPFLRKFPVIIDSKQEFAPMCGILTSSTHQKNECHIFSMRDINDITQFLNVIIGNRGSEEI